MSAFQVGGTFSSPSPRAIHFDGFARKTYVNSIIFPLIRKIGFVQTGLSVSLKKAHPLAGKSFEIRTFLYDTGPVNGREFVARARKYAKARGLAFEFDASRGKGSHGILKIGGRKTTVEFGEIPKGTFHGMLKQLRVHRKDF